MDFKTIFFSMFKKRKSTGIFTPSANGYKELQGKFEHKAINSISEYLGYHPDQVYAYLPNSPSIHAFVFEIFTEKLIFILTEDNISEHDLNLLSSYKKQFDPTDEYTSINTQTILQKGIENHSLSSEYLSSVLKISNVAPDGVFFVERLGLYLYFLDGYLVDFQTADGLNEWAKHFKELNSDFFNRYETEAKYYWGNNIPSILYEINMQMDAMANVPSLLKNEYIMLHSTNDFGTINFVMLLVCHYSNQINFEEFTKINFGRYIEIENNSSNDLGVKKYKVNLFTYEFLENGTLKGFYI